jgi:DNA topoisomerase-2
MVMFDENQMLKKFNSVDEIICYFCTIRLNYYTKRKLFMLDDYNNKLIYITNKLRFIRAVMNDELVLRNRDESDIITDLESNNYYKQIKDKNDIESVENGSYNYLLSMQIRSFTREKIESLTKDKNDLEDKIRQLQQKEEKTIWLNDLEELEREYPKFIRELSKDNEGKVRKK